MWCLRKNTFYRWYLKHEYFVNFETCFIVQIDILLVLIALDRDVYSAAVGWYIL